MRCAEQTSIFNSLAANSLLAGTGNFRTMNRELLRRNREFVAPIRQIVADIGKIMTITARQCGQSSPEFRCPVFPHNPGP
jgi:hypothetical protein